MRHVSRTNLLLALVTPLFAGLLACTSDADRRSAQEARRRSAAEMDAALSAQTERAELADEAEESLDEQVGGVAPR